LRQASNLIFNEHFFDGLINYADTLDDVYNELHPPNDSYVIVRDKNSIVINSYFGIFVFNTKTGDYSPIKKYRYLSVDELIGEKSIDKDVWPIVGEHTLTSLDLFQKKDVNTYTNKTNTVIKILDHTIEISVDGIKHEIYWQFNAAGFYDAIDFQWPNIWIATQRRLYKIEIDQNFQIVSKVSYLLAGAKEIIDFPYALKKLNDKIIIAGSNGIGVVYLSDLTDRSALAHFFYRYRVH